MPVLCEIPWKLDVFKCSMDLPLKVGSFSQLYLVVGSGTILHCRMSTLNEADLSFFFFFKSRVSSQLILLFSLSIAQWVVNVCARLIFYACCKGARRKCRCVFRGQLLACCINRWHIHHGKAFPAWRPCLWEYVMKNAV